MTKAKKDNLDEKVAQKAQKIDKKKSEFLIALKNKNGNISEACSATNVGRRTYYNWLEDDETFKQDAEDAQESLIDLAESKLVENIKDNDNTSIIFFLKTKGKKRGYIEKQEIEHTKPFEDIDLHGI